MNTKLIAKSDTGHAHDSRYNTKAEITTLLTAKADTGRTIAATKITGVLDTNQYQFGQYAIPSAGTTGQVWKSDGNGRGVWGTDSVGSATTSGVTSVGGSPAIDAATAAGAVTVSVKTGGIASAMLADTAVTSSKIKSNSIQTSHIADNQITSAKILNATIVQADLSADLSAKVDSGKAIGAFDDNIDNVDLIPFYSNSTLPLATVTIVAPAAGVILLNGSAQVQHYNGVTPVPVWVGFSITTHATIQTNELGYIFVVQANDNPTICHQTKGFSVNAGRHTYNLLIGRDGGNLTTVGVRNASLTAIYIRQ